MVLAKNWTPAEVLLLTEHYPTALKPELLSLIPSHSWQSIRWKANSLGLFLRHVQIRKPRDSFGKFIVRGGQGRLRRRFAVTCEVCGREFYVSPSRLKMAQQRGSTVRYCSVKCRSKAHTGEGNPFWGKRHSEDFIRRQRERIKIHPPGGRLPKRYRIVEGEHVSFSMEFSAKSSIKNKISHCEDCGYDRDRRILIMHHKNGNREDNDQNNLIIICPNCHALRHLRLLEEKGFHPTNSVLPPQIGFRGKGNVGT